MSEYRKVSRRVEILGMLREHPEGLTAAQMAGLSLSGLNERQLRHSLNLMLTDEIIVVVRPKALDPVFFHPDLPISLARVREIRESQAPEPRESGMVQSPPFNDIERAVAMRCRELMSRLQPVRMGWRQANAGV